MAELPQKANSKDNNEGMGDFTAMPAGVYVGQIKQSSYKQTKAKTGHFLELVITILSPSKYSKRTLYERLNLDNPNPIAVEISNKTLNSICKACDKVAVEDSEELHGIPFEMTLAVEPATKVNPESNNIKGYKKYAGGAIAETDTEPSTEESSEAGPEVKKKKLPWKT